MMAVEERVQHLLRTALRAEGEGERQLAELFRRMADDARPLRAVPSSRRDPLGTECWVD